MPGQGANAVAGAAVPVIGQNAAGQNIVYLPVRPESMLSSGDTRAPKFDPAYPRTLHRYFEDLETLFQRVSVQDEQDKKRFARHYVPLQVSDFWANLPTAHQPWTYAEYKAEIIRHYPGASEANRYQITDLDGLSASCKEEKV